ncbi:MAG: type II toxin-antitoxin system RelE/ParE family toxin [Prevotella sp.]|jgi:mRNA interferase RelE/StbE|nr:type II toxin-antitoxin system RelE/ParE family toxin [Prevotella sp.]
MNCSKIFWTDWKRKRLKDSPPFLCLNLTAISTINWTIIYKVIVNKQVFKSLDKIPKTYLLKIKSAVNDLAENPRPFGYVKLSGFDNLYRIRVEIYRIVYTIQDNILTVEVVKVDHRRSVCK